MMRVMPRNHARPTIARARPHRAKRPGVRPVLWRFCCQSPGNLSPTIIQTTGRQFPLSPRVRGNGTTSHPGLRYPARTLLLQQPPLRLGKTKIMMRVMPRDHARRTVARARPHRAKRPGVRPVLWRFCCQSSGNLSHPNLKPPADNSPAPQGRVQLLGIAQRQIRSKFHQK